MFLLHTTFGIMDPYRDSRKYSKYLIRGLPTAAFLKVCSFKFVLVMHSLVSVSKK